MSHLVTDEIIRSIDGFFTLLYGEDNIESWKLLKNKVGSRSEVEFVSWMLEAAEAYYNQKVEEQDNTRLYESHHGNAKRKHNLCQETDISEPAVDVHHNISDIKQENMAAVVESSNVDERCEVGSYHVESHITTSMTTYSDNNHRTAYRSKQQYVEYGRESGASGAGGHMKSTQDRSEQYSSSDYQDPYSVSGEQEQYISAYEGDASREQIKDEGDAVWAEDTAVDSDWPQCEAGGAEVDGINIIDLGDDGQSMDAAVEEGISVTEVTERRSRRGCGEQQAYSRVVGTGSSSQFQCTMCGKLFAQTSTVMRHVRDTHYRMRNHGCPRCLRRFARRSKRDQHMLQCTAAVTWTQDTGTNTATADAATPAH